MSQLHSLYLLKKPLHFAALLSGFQTNLKDKLNNKNALVIKNSENVESPMKTIKLRRTAATPKITLDKESGVMEIMGASIPEDADGLYMPIIEWVEEYSKNPNKKTVFNFGLRYFNTSSSKLLLDILLLLKNIYDNGNDVLIIWHTESHDDDMKETGLDYAEIIEVPFEFISTEDIDK